MVIAVGNAISGVSSVPNDWQHSWYQPVVGDQATLLSYDGDNRLEQSVALTNGTTLTTTVSYDPDGNALTQTVQTQMGTAPVSTRVSTTTVNAADWPTSTGDGPATGAPLVTAYQDDGAGQQRSQSVLTTTLPVTSVLNGDGLATALGESVGTSAPYTSTFGYAANDLPLTATLPGGPGVQEGRSYDGANRLLTLTLSGPPTATTVLSNTYLYAYNPASWTTAVTSAVSGITTTQVLTHDEQGRLTGAQSGSSTPSWSYDGNGNLLSATSPGASTSYSYQPSVTPNQLLSTTTGGVSTYYGYDQNGDTTAITTSAQTVNTQVSYDAQARPITVTLQGGLTATLSYNAAGQRASYTVVSGTTPLYAAQLSYRGSELGQAVVVSGTQSYTDTYLYRQDGTPLELIRQTPSGSTLATARYWYEVDGRGNVVALTDLTGTVVDRYAYDLWGAPTSVSESVPQRLRYAGYWYDQELGWYWVGVRYYDPNLKRWLQPDPSQAEGVRTYAYVGDDPVDATDLTGHGGCELEASPETQCGGGGEFVPPPGEGGPGAGGGEEESADFSAAVDAWAARFERFPVRGTTDAKIYKIRVAGPEEIRIPVEKGTGVASDPRTLDVDGIDARNGELIDAKYIKTPSKSPFISGSSIKPEIRMFINEQQESEFRRYAAIINDPDTPVVALRVITNDSRASPYFEELMARYHIPGQVVVEK